MKRTKYLLIFLVFFACKTDQSTKPETQAVVNEVEIPEEFVSFYNKFHSDSIFQMQHIVFPLRGSTKDQVYGADDWIMHKPFDNQGGTFQRSYNNLNGIIIEFVTEETGFATIERRFSKMGGDYHLIYYDIKTQFD